MAVAESFHSASTHPPRKKHYYSARFRGLQQAVKRARNPETSEDSRSESAYLSKRRHQPARKLFLQHRRKIHPKLRTRIQAQRIAICPIEQQFDWLLPR